MRSESSISLKGKRLCVLCLGAVCFFSGCFSPPAPELGQQRGLAQATDDHGRVYRRHTREPLVEFGAVLDWDIRSRGASPPTLKRSRGRSPWGKYSARIDWRPGTEPLSFDLYTKYPAELLSYADIFSLYSCVRSVLEPGEEQAVSISVLLQDGAQSMFVHPLGVVSSSRWTLLRSRADAKKLSEHPMPYRLLGLRVEVLHPEHAGTLLLESLHAYVDMKVKGRGSKTNAFADVALWDAPVSDDLSGTSPVQRSNENYRIAWGEAEEGFTCIWKPRRGLSSLEIHDGGGLLTYPFAGMVSQAHGAHVDIAAQGVTNKCIWADYASGERVRVFVHSNTLVVDVSSDVEQLKPWPMGRMGSSDRYDARSLELHDVALAHRLALYVLEPRTNDDAAVYFATLAFDLDESAASWMQRAGSAVDAAGQQSSPLRAVYAASSNGKHNRLRERIRLRMGRRVDDVLSPAHAPDMPRDRELVSRLWLSASEDMPYDALLERAGRWAQYGMTQLLSRVVRPVDAFAPSTQRCCLEDSPELGLSRSNAVAAAQQLERLGWMVAVQRDYRYLHPLDELWDESAVLRQRDQSWHSIDDGLFHVNVKHMLRVQEDRLGRQKDSYYKRPSFLMGLGQAPWVLSDYNEHDAHVGLFRGPLRLMKRMVGVEREQRGSALMGEGPYAGYYGRGIDAMVSLVSDVERKARPFFLPYRLYADSLPTFEVDAAISSALEPGQAALDRTVAAQLVNGRLGVFYAGLETMAQRCSLYYTMHAVQAHYAGRRPKSVAYWDGEHFLSLAEMIRDDGSAHAQYYLMYPNGLELWVNADTQKGWDVVLGDEQWTLPPDGWAVQGQDLLALSVLVHSQRVDYVRAPDYTYFNPRGSFADFHGVQANGALLIKDVRAWEQGSVLDVIVVDATQWFALSRELLGSVRVSRCDVFDIKGQLMKQMVAEPYDTFYRILIQEGGHRYRLFGDETN